VGGCRNLPLTPRSLTSWKEYFDHPEKKGTLIGIFKAAQTIGGVAGLPSAPIVTERWGRKWSISIGNVVVMIATALQTASTNVGMFIGSRGLVGFGLSFGE
jgi:MFS family permease